MKKGKSAKQETTIFGTVTSIEDNKNKNTASIVISTDEKDYIVETNRAGNELVDYLGEEVEATGILTKGKDGEDKISITKYEILDYDDEEYDEDEFDDEDEYFDDEDEDDEFFDDDDEYDEFFDDDDDFFDDEDEEYFDDDEEYYEDEDDDYFDDEDKPYRDR